MTLEPSTARLADARAAVAEALASARVALAEAERVVLALSEMATNAVHHSPATEIRIEVAVDGYEVELRVKQRAVGVRVPDPGSWRLPENPGQLSGRGLAIVAAVSDAVEVVVDGDIVEVRVRFVPRYSPSEAK